MADRPREFALIERCFAPLAAASDEALALRDDAALLKVGRRHDLVVTTDALVAGVHFLADETPEVIAARALRVNLSDLAAMGAEPKAYLLALALPTSIDDPWLSRFAAQLARDQATYSIGLVGGDTVSTPGPLTVCITAVGKVASGCAVTRSGAKLGDRIFVSGTIGDATLGLAALTGRLTVEAEADRVALIGRLRWPEPRIALGRRLAGVAHAMIDVSDGLVADACHICEQAGVGADIRSAVVPVSAAGRAALAVDPSWLPRMLTGGDDYELLFTAPNAAGERIRELAGSAGVCVTEIGLVAREPGVRVLDESGEPIRLERSGFVHF